MRIAWCRLGSANEEATNREAAHLHLFQNLLKLDHKSLQVPAQAFRAAERPQFQVGEPDPKGSECPNSVLLNNSKPHTWSPRAEELRTANRNHLGSITISTPPTTL